MYKNLLLLLTLTTSFQLCAQSLEDMMSYSFHSGLVTSPDPNAPAIAFVENTKGVRNLYYQGKQDQFPRKLTNYTQDNGQDISGIAFTDSTLYYVYGGASNRAGEFPNPTTDPKGAEQAIYQVSLEGGDLQRLDAGNSPVPFGRGILFLRSGDVYYKPSGEAAVRLFEMRGGVANLRLSPDGSKLAFISNRGDHSYACLYHFADSSLQIIQPTVDLDQHVVWSSDGSQLAFFRFPHETPKMFAARREALPFSIVTYDLKTDQVKTVWTADEGQGSAYRMISATDPLMWMTNDHLVFPWEKMGWTHLYALNPSNGKTTLLTPGELEVQFVSIAPDKTSIVFSSNQGDINRQHIWKIDQNLKLSSVTSGKGIEWSPVISDGNIYCHGSDGVTPASVYQSAGGKLELVKGTQDYPSEKLLVPEEIIYESADGMKIHAQLFKPKNIKKSAAHPAIVYMHGGSRRQMLAGFHHRGYYHHAYAMNQYLASQGYVVL
ncbi:MAG: DPP IV N-terminal domain-containing protein, partial [Ekhidna sp.]|nr:DPP IV N-terminal domain-containing protein [Ekhidna sp.]